MAPDNDRGMTAVKQEFAKRLYRRMIAKGWTQADLGRHAQMNRARVSTYIRGQSLPSPESLETLCKLFDCAKEDLIPSVAAFDDDTAEPAVELVLSATNPGRARLRVNMWMSAPLANQIMSLLSVSQKEPDNADDGKGSG